MIPPLLMDTADIVPHMDVITPCLMGKSFFFRYGPPFFSAEPELITISLATDGAGDKQ
jgi:hypothetical protein